MIVRLCQLRRPTPLKFGPDFLVIVDDPALDLVGTRTSEHAGRSLFSSELSSRESDINTSSHQAS
jgi:hypothetical protein